MAKKAVRKALPRKTNREVKIVPERLRKARTDAGMSQQELGYKSKVSPPDLSALENGTGTDLRTSGTFRIAEVLGVSMDWLCGRTEKTEVAR